MKLVKCDASGYEWEGEAGRRAKVTHIGAGSRLHLFGTLQGKATGEVAAYDGDASACSAIAVVWLDGYTPGSNAIKWKKGAKPKEAKPITPSARRTKSKAA